MKTLFEDEEKPKKILHKKITLTPKKIILHKKVKLPYEEEINDLLACTKNRMFISSSLNKEKELLSLFIVAVAKDYTEKRFREILEYAKIILREMSNYYVSQAIEASEEGVEWERFKNPYPVKKY